MAPSKEKLLRLAHVARRYYLEDWKQIDIARELGVSRPLVSRMLGEARELGVVQITVYEPGEESAVLLDRLRLSTSLQGGVLVEDGRIAAVGTNVEGKMVTALKRLGFDKVFDVDNAADFTIMEEATEFVQRVKNGGTLPLITSCSPGWVKFCETYYPDMIPNLSSCKSPQQMFGALTKTYYAEKMGLDPHDIVCVSVMPCTAKKFEIDRDDMSAAGDNIPDVDISITTRELGRMIERAGIKFTELPDEDFDPALGESTGAATIFGATGGVMEAALRTAVELVTGETLEKVEFHDVRGTDGIKEASYDVGGLHLNVCVASGLTNCDAVLKAVQSGEKHYDFIEFMACPGGCVNGGGQPTQPASVRNFTDLKALRAAALYGEDDAKAIRKSHENPLLKKVYAEYLGEPGGHKAHHILHTSYVAREKLY